ncbi:head completion/stabilization protein [Novispirillum itersonii]|uniref:head completion/stabilization protein n=1 Tax=Novispirillum itersonii TaxID=189 RepID=UPI000378CE54|nr:head completion/stabilization protein [Novispirillum itersonii]
MNSFIPSAPPSLSGVIPGDGWYPDLPVADFAATTGLGVGFSPDLIRETLSGAMLECMAGVAAWRAGQTAASLAGVPGPQLGNDSAAVLHWRRAVFALARARLLGLRPDHDATKDGLDRSDALRQTADTWLAIHAQALRALTSGGRVVVEAL